MRQKLLQELIEIALRGDWDTNLVSSNLRQLLSRKQLVSKAKDWRQRLCRLDTMAAEMLATPGAGALLAKANAVNVAINELSEALDQAASSTVIEEPVPKSRWMPARHGNAGFIWVDMDDGVTKGLVTRSGDGWYWYARRQPLRHGIVDTLEQAKAKVEEKIEKKVAETNTERCRANAEWVTTCGIIGRLKETYQVPTGKGTDTEDLGTIKPICGGGWDWCRHNSGTHAWKDGGGTVVTLEQAEAQVLRGWETEA